MQQNAKILEPQFQQIRDELKIPREFPPQVLAEAEAVATRDPLAPEFAEQFTNLREVAFITIDPPDSRDLDQAFFALRDGNAYLVRYAIADVGFFADPGSAIEIEAWQRGVTMYSPDIRTPLYPPRLCEDAASLLPDVTRAAIVFTFSLNHDGEMQSVKITRAVIQSRAKLSYAQVSEHLNAERGQFNSGALHGHEWSSSLALLEEIGRKREQLEIKRGGVSLQIPVQQVERWSAALTGYRLAFDASSEVENWNAQISLMTGMAAAQMMLTHRAGLLRVLDPPREDRLRALRLTASALNVAWPDEFSYAQFVRSLDPANPLHAVMRQQAAKVNGAARYVAFTDSLTATENRHAALAAHYTHVTAPLRRLADRYVLDLLVALGSGDEISAERIAFLQKLPEVMMQAEMRARQLESAIVNFAEARLLMDQIGHTFEAVIVGLKEEGLSVQITHPPIRTFISAAALKGHHTKTRANLSANLRLSADKTSLKIDDRQFTLGQSIEIELQMADPLRRTLGFLVKEASA